MKKQAVKHEIIKNPKNNRQSADTNDNLKMCTYSYNIRKFHKYI